MNCSDFLSRFTDYLDGSAPPDDVDMMEEHLEGCPTCGRYRAVLEGGASLLRSLPVPELCEDFEPRLRHRIYDVDDERVLSVHQSGTPALTVLGIAVLLSALAWMPVLLGGSRDVILDPIVVSGAPHDDTGLLPVLLLTPPGSFSTKTPSDLDDGLWENTLLYDYSALSQRYNQRARLRRVADYGR